MKLSSCFVQSSDVQKCMPHGPEIFVSRFKYQWITSTNLNLSFPVLLACNLVLCCLLKYYLLNANWAPTLHLHLTLRFHQRHRLIFLNTHLVYLNVLIDHMRLWTRLSFDDIVMLWRVAMLAYLPAVLRGRNDTCERNLWLTGHTIVWNVEKVLLNQADNSLVRSVRAPHLYERARCTR